MQQPKDTLSISTIWRGKKFIVETNSDATLKKFGHELQKLTGVKADTMRLIVPQPSNKGSKLLSPFSDEHMHLSLQETSILQGKSIRMMGVSEHEVDEVLKNAKVDLRIPGFEEEEKRLRQRMFDRPHTPQKLPQGNYIFCDFRTLELPGIVLNPPASEALKRMHMLAADPGIVAIMNKHRWRVGIMTEMAPVGYVGVSPKCILGVNKNHGEEISLRLRTDDLKGFRKYESIKKTLLHELAHMVYSEHDANFYALDKQLNQEAASLDWTKSRSHTLSGHQHSEHYEGEFYSGDSSIFSQKLGGKMSDQLESARASSVAAAYLRLANASTNNTGVAELHEEPDPDDSESNMHEEYDALYKKTLDINNPNRAQSKVDDEPDPDDFSDNQRKIEPCPHYESGGFMESELYSGINESKVIFEPDPDDVEMQQFVPHSRTDEKLASTKTSEEPDPDDLEVSVKQHLVVEPEPENSQLLKTLDSKVQMMKTLDEPDPDDSEVKRNVLGCGNISRLDHGNSLVMKTMEDQSPQRKGYKEPDPDDSQANGVMAEPDPDDNLVHPLDTSIMHTDEPDPDDEELQRIQDPVTVVCNRLQKAIEMLRSEVNATQAAIVLQTLFKIIRNLIEHPDEIKFRRLRKANPAFQRNIANYKAAMEVLFLIGFNEDVVSSEIGKVETYLVMKRNDPGLLWLVKSSLETRMAH